MKQRGDAKALCEQGKQFEHTGNLLLACDAFQSALRYAKTKQERLEADQQVARVSALMECTSFRPADYARSLHKAVSIYCYGRSGTHFLKSLLDGHPSIILSMLDGTKIWSLWDDMLSQGKAWSVAQLIETIFTVFPAEFNEGTMHEKLKMDGMCSLGDEQDGIFSIDKARFAEHFSAIVQSVSEIEDVTFLYQAVQLAASWALGRKHDFSRGIPVIVEGGIHFCTNHVQTKQFLQAFPSATLLQMVRNPAIAFASALKYQLHSGKTSLYNLCYQLVSLFHEPPLGPSGNNTYLVRLEDLHLYPRQTLMLVCDCLGIDWNDSLLHSTFVGMKWWNTSTSDQISGFTTHTISKTYDELLSPFDKQRLQAMLRVKYEAWGYPLNEWTSDDPPEEWLKIPFKFEALFSQDEATLATNRKMIHKLLLKQLNEERCRDDNDRGEYKACLLSPERTGAI